MNKTGIIILGIIFGPLIIIGIIKIISKLSGAVKIKLSASWGAPFVFLGKYFPSPKKLITWGLLVGMVYGFYLLYIYYRPTPERLAFRELSRNLAENELRAEKDTLKSLNEKVREGKTLTEKEKREAMAAEEKIRSVREQYSQGKLVPRLQALTKPKEVWDWTFEWEATAEQMASGKQKIVGRKNDAQIISRNNNVLKFRYKRPSGKIVNLTLDRGNPETEFYFGRVAQSDLYLRVWLLPDEKGNFKGQFDNGPGKTSMEVFLKKRS